MGVTKPSSVRILPYNCFPFYLAKGDNAEQKSSVNEIMFIPIVIGMHFQRKTYFLARSELCSVNVIGSFLVVVFWFNLEWPYFVYKLSPLFPLRGMSWDLASVCEHQRGLVIGRTPGGVLGVVEAQERRRQKAMSPGTFVALYWHSGLCFLAPRKSSPTIPSIP